jgi:hypothetical protein
MIGREKKYGIRHPGFRRGHQGKEQRAPHRHRRRAPAAEHRARGRRMRPWPAEVVVRRTSAVRSRTRASRGCSAVLPQMPVVNAWDRGPGCRGRAGALPEDAKPPRARRS